MPSFPNITNIFVKSACKVYVCGWAMRVNMSVLEVCDVDSREKWDVTSSNKCFFEPFFCDFLQKNLAYEKLNPYICRCVMEYPLVGVAKHIYY